MICWISNNRV